MEPYIQPNEQRPSPYAGVQQATAGYNTHLPMAQEYAFRQFIKSQTPPYLQQQRAALQGTSDYDYRAWFADPLRFTENRFDGLHYSDIGKKPTHPSFSNESTYAPLYPELATPWRQTKTEWFKQPTMLGRYLGQQPIREPLH